MAIALASIFVVRRDRPDLYEHLRARLGPTNQVILDRREGERRRAAGPMAADRRRIDRRQAPTHAERLLWQDAGYCVIFQPVTAPAAASGTTETTPALV